MAHTKESVSPKTQMMKNIKIETVIYLSHFLYYIFLNEKELHSEKCDSKNTNDEKIITLSQLNSYLKSATKVITFF